MAKNEWRNALISGVVSVVLAVTGASIGWSYQAGQFEAELRQTQEKVMDIHELTEQMKVMNQNIAVIQTEMKYYRRDIDDLREKQKDMSVRLDTISGSGSSD